MDEKTKASEQQALASYLRGLARGLGPDLLGGPVDLARDALNLGIAGVGYAGHKTGLLKEPLPLIEPGAVGDSDWWARLTNVSDDNTPQYTAGRLTPVATSLAGAASSGAKRLVNAMVSRPAPSRSGAPPTLKSQEGALYPGGREDLMAYHDTTLNALGNVTTKGGTTELSNPSLAVTKDAIPANFSLWKTGSSQLIPRVGAFDPATSASTLLNRDAYTARWGQFQGQPLNKLQENVSQPLESVYPTRKKFLDAVRSGKIDWNKATIMGGPVGGELGELFSKMANKDPAYLRELQLLYDGKPAVNPELRKQPNWTQDFTDYNRFEHFRGLIEIPTGGTGPTRQEAAKRLSDRLFTPSSGKYAAGREGDPIISAEEGLNKKRFDGEISGRLSQDLAIKASPAFRSFKDYEASPKGAKLLTQDAKRPLHDILDEEAVWKAFRNNELGATWFSVESPTAFGDLTQAALQAKVRGRSPEGIYQAMKSADSADEVPESVIRDLALGDKQKAFYSVLEDTHKAFANSPSQYGELKVHGVTTVSPENFAGVVLRRPLRDPWFPDREVQLPENQQRIVEALVNKGIPVASTIDPYDDKAAFMLADTLQKQAGPARKRRMFEK